MFLNLIKKKVSFTLENSDGKIDFIDQYDISVYLDIVYQSDNQFIILKPSSPLDDIEFIQAVKTKNQNIEVDVMILRGNERQLCCKICTQEECTKIFDEFYKEHRVFDLNQYKPVKF